jgi:cell division septal protein FtsQ
MSELKKELEKIEWVDSVSIRRDYPRVVILSIKEHNH